MLLTVSFPFFDIFDFRKVISFFDAFCQLIQSIFLQNDPYFMFQRGKLWQSACFSSEKQPNILNDTATFKLSIGRRILPVLEAQKGNLI